MDMPNVPWMRTGFHNVPETRSRFTRMTGNHKP